MKILNVGCGKSKYGTHFIDINPQRDDIIKSNVENGIPFNNDYFDEVYSENLFEHLKNPHFTLSEMYRVLKPKGKLVLITDNASFWGWHVPFAKTHYGGYEKYSYEKDKHMALFTSWHLINHFKSLSLRNIKIKYLLTKEKNPYLIVRLVSKFLGFFLRKNWISFNKGNWYKMKTSG